MIAFLQLAIKVRYTDNNQVYYTTDLLERLETPEEEAKKVIIARANALSTAPLSKLYTSLLKDPISYEVVQRSEMFLYVIFGKRMYPENPRADVIRQYVQDLPKLSRMEQEQITKLLDEQIYQLMLALSSDMPTSRPNDFFDIIVAVLKKITPLLDQPCKNEKVDAGLFFLYQAVLALYDEVEAKK